MPGCGVAGSAAAYIDPARDEAGVCSGVDAQLSGAKVPLLVQVAFVHSDRKARVPGIPWAGQMNNRAVFRDNSERDVPAPAGPAWQEGS